MNWGSLAALPLELSYRSDRQNLVREFYEPCLLRTQLYRRAVGFFSSSGIACAAEGIAALVVNGGAIRLIASPNLSEEDAAAIRFGEKSSDEAIKRICAQSFLDVRDAIVHDRLNALSWLVAKRILSVKLAIRVNQDGTLRRGIYHEKVGIFSDSSGNAVAFTGSSNETQGGLVDNFEVIDVFASWSDREQRVVRKIHDYEELWSNSTAGLQILEFTDIAEELLANFRSKEEPEWENLTPKRLMPPSPSRSWRHQDTAIAAFLTDEHGVLEMATGTGKTRTALKICERLALRGDVKTVIVSADGTDLLDQWARQLVHLGKGIGLSLPLYRHYAGYKQRDDFLLEPEYSVFLCSRPELAAALTGLSEGVGRKTLLIHDEVHRLGSPGNRKALLGKSAKARFRLGLSATPEREYDEEGTSFIESEIGNILFQFTLEDAISAGILAPFTYYPLSYTPTVDDKRKIAAIFKKEAARKAAGDPMSPEEIGTEISRVYKLSQAKLPVFDEFIRSHQELLRRCIIFVETKEYGQEVLALVHKYVYEFHIYFGEEDPSILDRFSRGEISCLLTCHRLSEGIDIQSLETVILFSSAKSRLETIQRMGRCLRLNPSQPRKTANIIDFVRQNDEGNEGENSDEQRQAWLEKLSRIKPS